MGQIRQHLLRILEAPPTDVQPLRVPPDELFGVEAWIPSLEQRVAQHGIHDVSLGRRGREFRLIGLGAGRHDVRRAEEAFGRDGFGCQCRPTRPRRFAAGCPVIMEHKASMRVYAPRGRRGVKCSRRAERTCFSARSLFMRRGGMTVIFHARSSCGTIAIALDRGEAQFLGRCDSW